MQGDSSKKIGMLILEENIGGQISFTVPGLPDPKVHTLFRSDFRFPFIEAGAEVREGRAFLKVTHYISSRGGFGT